VDLAQTTLEVGDLVTAFERARERIARGFGRTAGELATLAYAEYHGGATPVAISQRLGLTSGTITALIDRLEAADLVERRPNPTDRRSLLVVTTPAGSKMADQFITAMRAAIGVALRDTDPDTVKSWRFVARSVTEALDDIDRTKA
jgi:DNA-binding MarR family transcriptional regulator